MLATVDVTSYVAGTMGSHHPLVWCHDPQGGRSLNAAMATPRTAAEEAFRGDLWGATRWVLHRS